MEHNDHLRVLPKGGKTKPLRCKAKPSSVKLYYELLQQFHDITSACDDCVSLVSGVRSLSASARHVSHECQKNRLIAFHKETDGIFMRPLCVKFKPTESGSMCKHVVNGVECFARKECPFPHSYLENHLWKRDFTHEISLLNFMQDLDRSSLRAEHLIANVTEKIAGEFLLLCKTCWFSRKDGTD